MCQVAERAQHLTVLLLIGRCAFKRTRQHGGRGLLYESSRIVIAHQRYHLHGYCQYLSKSSPMQHSTAQLSTAQHSTALRGAMLHDAQRGAERGTAATAQPQCSAVSSGVARWGAVQRGVMQHDTVAKGGCQWRHGDAKPRIGSDGPAGPEGRRGFRAATGLSRKQRLGFRRHGRWVGTWRHCPYGCTQKMLLSASSSGGSIGSEKLLRHSSDRSYSCGASL